MRRAFVALASLSLVAGVSPATAQDKSSAQAVATALSGTWTFDPARSDSSMYAGPRQRAANPAQAVDAGGGGGRRGGGGGGGGGGGARMGGGARGGGGAADGLMAEMRPPRQIVIVATVDSVVLPDAQGTMETWRLDGKKRQVAQMTGGLIEYQAEWKGKSLVLIKSMPGGGKVEKELKLDADGTLQLKSVLQAGRKTEQEWVFTRAGG